MERGMAAVLSPTNTTSSIKVLLNKMATLLKVINPFDSIAPSKLLPDNLGLLDVDPLLPDQMLPHLQHRHRVLVRILHIEVVRRRFVEFHSLLPPHFLSLALSAGLVGFVFFADLGLGWIVKGIATLGLEVLGRLF